MSDLFNFENHDDGLFLSLKTQSHHFKMQFGNTQGTVASFSEKNMDLKFKRIKQVHGDKVVHTSLHSMDYASEADAHYSAESNLALCILTADCFPIFILQPEQNNFFAIHAGWRGIANRIVPKSLQKAKSLGFNLEKTLVICGPHIQKQSFEIQNDVRDQLFAASKSAGINSNKNLLFQETSATHGLFDLNLLLKLQLQEFQIEEKNIFISEINTVSDLNYHSFRRDRDKSGRQVSWICRIN